jgi:putative flavoprotein involved in K+ transport
MIDGYIEAQGLDAAAEVLDQFRNAYSQKIITELDLNQHGITTIIWATGYTFDYSNDKTTSI